MKIGFRIGDDPRDRLYAPNDLGAADLIEGRRLGETDKDRGQSLIEIKPWVALPSFDEIQLPARAGDSGADQEIVNRFGSRLVSDSWT